MNHAFSISFIFAAYELDEGVESTLKHLIRLLVLSGEKLRWEILVICVKDKDAFTNQFANEVKVFQDGGGIAKAWNIGLAHSVGSYVCFVGDGDYVGRDAIAYLCDGANDRLGGEVINFQGLFFRNGELARRMGSASVFSVGILGVNVQTPCLVIPKILLEDFRFSEKYKIAMDIEMVIHLQSKGASLAPSPYPVLIEENGVSVKSRGNAIREYSDILLDHGVKGARFLPYILPMYGLYRLGKDRFRAPTRNILRTVKHILVFLLNVTSNLIPGGFVRNSFLKLLRIKVGKGSSIRSVFRIYGPANITIGRNSVVNRGCVLDNRGIISIGDNVSIAHEVSIYTAGHNLKSPFFEQYCKPVIIEDYVAVFPRVIINPGVRLSRGCVVLGGSAVYGQFPENSIIAGNPARIVGSRLGDYKYSSSYDFRFAQ